MSLPEETPDILRKELPRLQKLERTLEIRFQNLGFYLEALTHRSVLGSRKPWPYRDNERLEFLGDAVLSAIISHLLFERYGRDYREGELTKMRAWLVNEERLAKVAKKLTLDQLIPLGPGEEATGGREKASILAGALEALIAALYLDLGFEKTFLILKRIFAKLLPHAPRGLVSDFKTVLQEYTQKLFKKTPSYQLIRETGPEHEKVFYVAVSLEGEELATGRGRSKKAAEQDAAQKALKKLEEKYGPYEPRRNHRSAK
jgi:ribonuclease-3